MNIHFLHTEAITITERQLKEGTSKSTTYPEEDQILQIIRNYNKSIVKYNSIKYSFSHFDLFIDIYLGYVKKEIIHSHKWIKLNNVNKIGFPTIMKKIYESYKIN